MEMKEHGRILIFGRDMKCMTSLYEILAKSGYTSSGYTSREDALEILKIRDFDLIMIDIEMPDPDCIILLRAALSIAPHLMSIIITNHGMMQAPVKSAGINVFDHVHKPFKVEELLGRIDMAIEVGRLKKSEGIYKAIFEDAAEGIYLVTPEEQYITANKTLSQMFGYTSSHDMIDSLNKKDLQFYVQADRSAKLFKVIKKIGTVSGFESEVYRKDGSKLWISENICAVRDINNRIIYFRGSVEDITRRKETIETLCESEKHLRIWAEKAENDKEIYLDIIDELCGSCRQFEGLFNSFVTAIVNALDERSPWNKGHSQRVASYSMKIAMEIGFSSDEMEKLRLAALLHDIGQILYDRQTDKPETLTDEEYEVIKKHPVMGVSILSKVKQLKDIIPIIKHHHERVDGRGYPDGLRGEEIPVEARILHIADSFDSMTVDRPYRRAPGKEYAILELKRCNNTQFDPKIAEVAMRVL